MQQDSQEVPQAASPQRSMDQDAVLTTAEKITDSHHEMEDQTNESHGHSSSLEEPSKEPWQLFKETYALLSTFAHNGAKSTSKKIQDLNLTCMNSRQQNLLHAALEKGDIKLAEYLIALDVDVKATDEQQQTPLHYAVEQKCVLEAVEDTSLSAPSIISTLIEAGANIQAKNAFGFSPLRIAVRKKRFNMVQELLNAPKENVDFKDPEPIIEACKKNNAGILHLLLKSGFQVEAIKYTGNLLNQIITFHSSIDTVKILVKAGIDLRDWDEGGHAPIHNAVIFKRHDVLKVLIKAGVDPDSRDKTGETPLRKAVRGRLPKMVKILLVNGASLNAKTEGGKMVFDLALLYYDRATTLALLQARPAKYLLDSAFDYKNRTLMHYAVKRGHSDVIIELMKCGASTDIQDDDGETAWYWATRKHQRARMSKVRSEKQGAVPAQSIFPAKCPLETEEGIDLHISETGDDPTTSQSKPKIAKVTKYISDLFEAIQENDLEALKTLINEGADPNSIDEDGSPVLHKALCMGRTSMVEHLLKSGASTTLQDSYGQTFVQAAIKSGNSNLLVRALAAMSDNSPRMDELKHLCKLAIATYDEDMFLVLVYFSNFENNIGTCISEHSKFLHMTIEKKNIDLVISLLHEGVDPNAKDEEGKTPLHKCATWCEHVVEKLLQFGAVVDSRDRLECTPLHVSLAGNKTKIAKILLLAGANPKAKNIHDETAIDIAVAKANINALSLLKRYVPDMKALISHYVHETNSNGKTLLHMAIENNNNGLVQLFVEAGASWRSSDISGLTSIDYALKHYTPDIMLSLLKADLNDHEIDMIGMKVIHLATRRNDVSVLQKLLQLNVNPNLQDISGQTPLLVALADSHMRAARILVSYGASFTIPDNTGKEPIYYLVEQYDEEMVTRCLQRCGARVANVVSSYDKTLLHLAASAGHLEIARSLIKCKADVNAVDYLDRTPLHYAALANNLPVVQCLVQHGADRNLQDCNGDSPLTLTGNQHIVDFLQYKNGGRSESIRSPNF